MVSVQRTLTVSKPIEQVVEYLADFAHAQEWDPGTKTCTLVSSGPVRGRVHLAQRVGLPREGDGTQLSTGHQGAAPAGVPRGQQDGNLDR